MVRKKTKKRVSISSSFRLFKGTSLLASLLFFISPIHSEVPYGQDFRLTVFRWVPSGQLEGKCLEIDRRTHGEEFSVERPPASCRHLVEQVDYYWFPHSSGVGGDCYEVDSEKKGLRYSRRVRMDDCRPEDYRLVWDKDRCFEKGRTSNDQDYKRAVERNRCLERAEMEYVWVTGETPWTGRCHQIDKKTQGRHIRVPVTAENCRPEQTSTVWRPIRGHPQGGQCLIVHAEKGSEAFVQSTQASDCLESLSEYRWVQTGPFTGDCYEGKRQSSGEIVPQKVSSDLCRPERVITQFVRTSQVSGQCLELDQLTQGEQFKRSVSLSRCRPENAVPHWVSNQNGTGGRCYLLDRETGGDQYIEPVLETQCHRPTSKYVFKLKSSGLEGECFEVIVQGGQEREVRTSLERCRTNELRHVWHGDPNTLIGRCYAIDQNQGPQGFIEPVSAALCKPFYLEDVTYRFHRAPSSTTGQCFEVDKATGGLNYAVTVNHDRCRKILTLPD